jgi:hypothetical protein
VAGRMGMLLKLVTVAQPNAKRGLRARGNRRLTW